MSKSKDYTLSFTVDQTPAEVFDAINKVPAWWSGEVTGNTETLGAEFTYTAQGVHRSQQKITEFEPDKKVVWRVLDADLSFTKDKSEWKGTEMVFDITKKSDKTEVRFTHIGLAPALECFSNCSSAWGLLVKGNLRRLIETGEAQPSPW